jgi:4-amino-4-deoxy-L-arabinose transferase-like glycosyltransferase
MPTSSTFAALLRRGRPYFWMVVIAFVLRLALIFILQSYELTPDRIRPFWPRLESQGTSIQVPREIKEQFAFGYEVGSVAASIVRGEGFGSPFGGSTGPTAWLGPVYPYLCAAVFGLAGSYTQLSAFLIFAINSLFSALTCIPIVLIGEHTLGRHIGVRAAWLWATLPWFMQWPTTWVWEMPLSALLLSLLVLLALRLSKNSEGGKWLGFGGLWGLSALTNPSLLSFLPFSLGWPALKLRRQGRSYLAPVALAVLACSVIVTPWLMRHRLVFGEFVFIRSNFWYEFHLGNYHNSNGMGWGGKHPSVNILQYDKYIRLGELEYVASAKRDGQAFLRRHPDEFVRLSLRRMAWFWSGTYLLYSATTFEFWTPGIVFGFSALSLLGLLLALWRRVNGSALFLLLLTFYPAVYYITYPQGRYRHAIEPVLLLLAAYLIYEVSGYLRARLQSSRLTDEA